MKKRLVWLDTARGIAVLLVVYGHLFPYPHIVPQWIHSFHMPLFFLLSGILFFVKKEDSLEPKFFFLKKLKGILFPYFTISFANVIFVAIRHRDFVQVLLDTIRFEGNLTLWFLPALFIAEVVCFLWLSVYKKNKFIAVAVFLMILCGTTIFSAYKQHHTNTLLLFTTPLNRGLIGFIFVLTGCFSAKFVTVHKKFNDIMNRSLSLCLIATSCAVIHFLLFRYDYVDLRTSVIGNPFLYYINALSGSFFIILLMKCFGNHSRLLSYFGVNSLIIFSTHHNFGITSVAARIMNYFSITWTYGQIIRFLIVIVIELLLCIVINKFFRFFINYNELKKLVEQFIKKVKHQ